MMNTYIHHHELDFDDVVSDSHGDIHQITNNVFICSLKAAKNETIYTKLGIKARINISSDICENSAVYLININIKDEPDVDISQFFNLTYKILTLCIDNNHRVVVNCRAGISRSATIILAFLMRRYDLSLEIALHYLRSIRPIVNPNVGFLEQLIEYGKALDHLRSICKS